MSALKYISHCFDMFIRTNNPEPLTVLDLFLSVFGGVRVLWQLGWLRLLSSSGPQQLGVGNTPGHTAHGGKHRLWPRERKKHVFGLPACWILLFRWNEHTLIETVHTQNQAHRFLHRMGHSLVSEPQGNLWMYGGLSLSAGILGNVYRYSHIKRSLFFFSLLSWMSFFFLHT